jgi:hypothetical protein
VIGRRREHEEGFCEIRYSWYVERHHTLKRHTDRYRVVEQMNDLIEDHRAFGYVERAEYRAIKEPGQEIDYIIRYYPGQGARDSVNRIRSRHPRRKKAAQEELPPPANSQPALPPMSSADEPEPEAELLIGKLTAKPPEGFGISEAKARDLVQRHREAVEEQLAAYQYRDMDKPRKNAAGWLIAAIEENFALPAAYVEELEKKRQAAKSVASKAAVDGCQLCDANGWRRIRTPEHPNGAMKRCSHNEAAEAEYLSA